VRWPLVSVGVLLTSLATLLVELTLTRIFSVVFYYHFAFLAISIAMFGLGIGGVLSYLFTNKAKVYQHLGLLSSLNALFVVGSVSFLLSRPAEVDTWQLAAVYLASAVPFLVSGIVLSLAISEGISGSIASTSSICLARRSDVCCSWGCCNGSAGRTRCSGLACCSPLPRRFGTRRRAHPVDGFSPSASR